MTQKKKVTKKAKARNLSKSKAKSVGTEAKSNVEKREVRAKVNSSLSLASIFVDLKKLIVSLKPTQVLFPALLDMFFLICISLIGASYSKRLIEEISLLTVAVGTNSEEMVSTFFATPRFFEMIGQYPEIGAHLGNIFSILFALSLSGLVVYLLIQSFTWYLSIKTKVTDLSVMDYVKRFALLNLIWYIPYVIYNGLTFLNNVSLTFAARFGSVSVISGWSLVYLIIGICAVYFAGIQYALISNNSTWSTVKKSFSMGVKNFKSLIPVYAVFLAIFLSLNFLIGLLMAASPWIAFAVVVFIVVPLFTVTRIFISKVVLELDGVEFND